MRRLTLALALGLLVASALATAEAASTSLEATPLDARIALLEDAVRRPASAAEWRDLAAAYAARADRTGSTEDRARALDAEARAERIEGRTAMRGSPAFFGVSVVVIVVAGALGWALLSYNGLARSDEGVNERWSHVEASLQRRLDLVPQLVASVKGYAEHERGTLEAVTQARMRAQGALGQAGGASPTAVAESQQALGEALRGLNVLVERYPDLEASGNFASLQDQLEGTENRLAVERQRYNEAVRGYNERLRVFPSALVARAFGFAPREYFESKRGAEDAVAVTF